MTITWQTLLSVAAIIAAIIALWGYLTKVVHCRIKMGKPTDMENLLNQIYGGNA